MVVDNVPRIRDVTALLEGLRHLGVRVEVDEAGTVRLDASQLKAPRPRPRGDVAAPRLGAARAGPARADRPGRAAAPRRRPDRPAPASTPTCSRSSELGARVAAGPALRLTLEGRFRGAEVFLDEMSVTATENTVMAAVLAEGTPSS